MEFGIIWKNTCSVNKMSGDPWKSILLKYNKDTKHAECNIVNQYGQEPVGIYQLSFKKLQITYLQKIENLSAVLSCSGINNISKDDNGVVTIGHSPLELLLLNGERAKIETIDLSSHPYYQFSDIKKISAWIQDLENNPINIKLHVHCVYRKL